MDNKFSLKNFIEKEAEEEKPIKNLKSDEIQIKDTQYSSVLNQEEDDSYGLPSDNDTEKNSPKKVSKELASHRLILQNEIKKEEKDINKKLKRKMIPIYEKKDNKRIIEHAKKNNNKIEASLGIINGKLNIGFAENKENQNINDKQAEDTTTTPEKKFRDEEDEEIIKLKLSNEKKKIEKVNKQMNNDFIKRIKENEDFIKSNNIIINDGTNINNAKNIKRNKSDININLNKKNQIFQRRLKLYSFKGAFLNKNKK